MSGCCAAVCCCSGRCSGPVVHTSWQGCAGSGAGGAAVISIGLLGAGRSAADYYLSRQAGCALEYYTGVGERPGRWVGRGAQALGLSGELDATGQEALRALLAGHHPGFSDLNGEALAGRVLVGPVWRADPRGRLPASPLVSAVDAVAADQGVPVGVLLADQVLVKEYARLTVPGRRSVPAALAGRLAVAAGLDPAVLYPARGKAVGYTRALELEGERIDVRRAGLDVTVSAPKSVSVLWAVADPHVAGQVQRAHEQAVGAALQYLQGEAGHALRGHQGDGQRAGRVGTDGLIVAAFEHRTSRAGDPQLHTHLVVPNLLRGQDGRWSAVDSRALYRQALTASHVYHLMLRSTLTDRLGVQWGPVRRGIAELSGIPSEVRREFSSRKRQIDAALAETGRSGPAAAQQACLATRPAKAPAGSGQDAVTLRQRWAGQLIELGHDPATLTREVLDRGTAPPRPEPAELAQQLLEDSGLTDKRSSFDRRAVLQGLCEQIPAGTTIDLPDLLDLASHVLADPRVIPLVADAPGAPDGPGSFGGAGGSELMFSTTGMVRTEQTAIALAHDQQRAGRAVVGLPQALAAMAATAPGRDGRPLSPAQAAAVLTLTGSGRGVEVVVGAAGSGKTAALAAAHTAWTAAGHPVLGTALAASAARNLQNATGIGSSSLARLLGDLDTARSRGEPALQPGSVLVLDEAGMVGTRDLHRLLEHTAAADAKLILVGDPAQLPEIHAGGLFAHLAHQLPAIRLTENHRQQHSWERTALQALRAGRTDTALRAYADEHRIKVAPTGAALTAGLAHDYLQLREQTPSPYDVLVVTARRADARTANDAIRAQLHARGQLGPQITVDTGQSQPISLAVGDLVLITRNDYRLGLLNGTRATITTLDPGTATGTGVGGATAAGAGSIGLRTSEDRTVTVPLRWLADGRLEHGYALTCHKAQGLTVEHALVYGTGALSQQSGYVAMSRGRSSNHLYTALDVGRDYDPSQRALTGPDDPAVLPDLLRALTADRRQHLASSRLPAEQGPPRPAWLDQPQDHFAESIRAVERATALAEQRSHDHDLGLSR